MKTIIAAAAALAVATPAAAALHFTFDMHTPAFAGSFAADFPYAPWVSVEIAPQSCLIQSKFALTCGNMWLFSDVSTLTNDPKPLDAIGFGVNGLYGPDYPFWYYFPEGALGTAGTYQSVMGASEGAHLTVSGVADVRPPFVRTFAAVPEPSTWLMLGLGMFGLGAALRLVPHAAHQAAHARGRP